MRRQSAGNNGKKRPAEKGTDLALEKPLREKREPPPRKRNTGGQKCKVKGERGGAGERRIGSHVKDKKFVRRGGGRANGGKKDLQRQNGAREKKLNGKLGR